MNRKYLVFLDIDGVFTSSRVHYAHNASYDMWHRFDPVAIDFMNKIHDRYPVECDFMPLDVESWTWTAHIMAKLLTACVNGSRNTRICCVESLPILGKLIPMKLGLIHRGCNEAMK